MELELKMFLLKLIQLTIPIPLAVLTARLELIKFAKSEIFISYEVISTIL